MRVVCTKMLSVPASTHDVRRKEIVPVFVREKFHMNMCLILVAEIELFETTNTKEL